jgi:hypothetical protein
VGIEHPEFVFPPTDFHSATLVGDSIYVIGSLGYVGAFRYGETPVYRLDLRTLRIDRLDTGGEAPGWIYSHRAAPAGQSEIRVCGGTVVTGIKSGGSQKQNVASFVLDLVRLRWRRE